MKKAIVVRSECLRYSETFIREQVLACKSWDITLVGNENAGGLPLDELNARIFRGWLGGQLGRLVWRLGMIPPAVTRQVKALGAAVAHVHFGTNAVEWMPVLRRLNVPVIVTLHGYDIMTSRATWARKAHTGFGDYPRKLLTLAKNPNVHFIAVSEAVKARAISFGLPAERITVHYIGIDPARFTPSPIPVTERPRRILAVGRLVEKKGGRILLEAFARVRQAVPDAELVMVGNGPLQGALEARAAELGVPVTFTGSLPPAEVKQQMHQARVFCLPSITAADGDAEGFGLVILEAQACGVPVVTSALGGSTEGLIEGVTGFAFAEKDVDTLTQRLAQVLLDDALAARMAAAGPAFVAERFDVSVRSAELEAYYDDITARGAKRA